MNQKVVAASILVILSLSAFSMIVYCGDGHDHQSDCQSDVHYHLESSISNSAFTDVIGYYTYVYTCPVCGMTFTTERACQAHIDSVHGPSPSDIFLVLAGIVVVISVVGAIIVFIYQSYDDYKYSKKTSKWQPSSVYQQPPQQPERQQSVQREPPICTDNPELVALIAHHSAQKLMDAGFDAPALTAQGVYASDLRRRGFSAYDLFHILNFTRDQLVAGGYTLQELDEAEIFSD